MVDAVGAESVTVVRSGNALLEDVDVTVEPGEVLGVVGPNGAGKTTLLRVLSGDIHPSRGRATIMGETAAAATVQHLAHLRSYVAPQVSADISFRVGQVVAMGRHPHRVPGVHQPDEDRIVGDAMERFDISHLVGREVRTLSSGEKQRVALARAVAQQAPVMLLDEPTSALDVGHQELVMTVLRELADDGVAVAVVLHDLNLGAAFADRVLLLDRGRAVAVGTPRQVFTGDALSRAYRVPMQVIDHPFRNCPLVLTAG